MGPLLGLEAHEGLRVPHSIHRAHLRVQERVEGLRTGQVHPCEDVVGARGDGHVLGLDQLRHPNVVVIPGAKSVAQLEANAAAADITLSDDEAADLTTASDGFRMVPLWRSAPQVLRRLAGPGRALAPHPTDAEGGDR